MTGFGRGALVLPSSLRKAAWIAGGLGVLWLAFNLANTASVTVVNETGEGTVGGFAEICDEVRPIKPLAPGDSQRFVFAVGGECGVFTGLQLRSGKIAYGGVEYLMLHDFFAHRVHRATPQSGEIPPENLPSGFQRGRQ